MKTPSASEDKNQKNLAQKANSTEKQVSPGKSSQTPSKVSPGKSRAELFIECAFFRDFSSLPSDPIDISDDDDNAKGNSVHSDVNGTIIIDDDDKDASRSEIGIKKNQIHESQLTFPRIFTFDEDGDISLEFQKEKWTLSIKKNTIFGSMVESLISFNPNKRKIKMNAESPILKVNLDPKHPIFSPEQIKDLIFFFVRTEQGEKILKAQKSSFPRGWFDLFLYLRLGNTIIFPSEVELEQFLDFLCEMVFGNLSLNGNLQRLREEEQYSVQNSFNVHISDLGVSNLEPAWIQKNFPRFSLFFGDGNDSKSKNKPLEEQKLVLNNSSFYPIELQEKWFDLGKQNNSYFECGLCDKQKDKEDTPKPQEDAENVQFDLCSQIDFDELEHDYISNLYGEEHNRQEEEAQPKSDQNEKPKCNCFSEKIKFLKLIFEKTSYNVASPMENEDVSIGKLNENENQNEILKEIVLRVLPKFLILGDNISSAFGSENGKVEEKEAEPSQEVLSCSSSGFDYEDEAIAIAPSKKNENDNEQVMQPIKKEQSCFSEPEVEFEIDSEDENMMDSVPNIKKEEVTKVKIEKEEKENSNIARIQNYDEHQPSYQPRLEHEHEPEYILIESDSENENEKEFPIKKERITVKTEKPQQTEPENIIRDENPAEIVKKEPNSGTNVQKSQNIKASSGVQSPEQQEFQFFIPLSGNIDNGTGIHLTLQKNHNSERKTGNSDSFAPEIASIYLGSWKNGEKDDNHAVLKTQDFLYEGSFKKDVFDGSGKLRMLKGRGKNSSYTGNFSEGKRDGFGTQYYSIQTPENENNMKKHRKNQFFIDENGIEYFSWYRGTWSQDERDGFGEFRTKDEWRVGEWNENKFYKGIQHKRKFKKFHLNLKLSKSEQKRSFWIYVYYCSEIKHFSEVNNKILIPKQVLLTILKKKVKSEKVLRLAQERKQKKLSKLNKDDSISLEDPKISISNARDDEDEDDDFLLSEDEQDNDDASDSIIVQKQKSSPSRKRRRRNSEDDQLDSFENEEIIQDEDDEPRVEKSASGSNITAQRIFLFGYYFRSKLEARWALFFTILRVDFLYEPKTFVIPPTKFQGEARKRKRSNSSNTRRYTPDFYLPNLKIWLEIKPCYPTEEEREKAQLLANILQTEDNEQRVILLHGSVHHPFVSKHIPGAKGIEFHANLKENDVSPVKPSPTKRDSKSLFTPEFDDTSPRTPTNSTGRSFDDASQNGSGKKSPSSSNFYKTSEPMVWCVCGKCKTLDLVHRDCTELRCGCEIGSNIDKDDSQNGTRRMKFFTQDFGDSQNSGTSQNSAISLSKPLEIAYKFANSFNLDMIELDNVFEENDFFWKMEKEGNGKEEGQEELKSLDGGEYSCTNLLKTVYFSDSFKISLNSKCVFDEVELQKVCDSVLSKHQEKFRRVLEC